MRMSYKKSLLQLSAAVAMLLSLQSCGVGDGSDGIAVFEDGAIIVDYTAATTLEEKTVNLSDLITDYSCVQLDVDAEAYVDKVLSVSDNYILACRAVYSSSAVKLFDRKSGKFLRDIGSVGNGLGEYPGHYTDLEIDEGRGRVYVLSRYIMVYGVDGTFIKKVETGDDVQLASLSLDMQTGNILVSGKKGQEDIIYKISSEGDILSQVSAKGEYSDKPIISINEFVQDLDHQYLFTNEYANRDKVLFKFDSEQMSSSLVLRLTNLGVPEVSGISEHSLFIGFGSIGEYYVVLDTRVEAAVSSGLDIVGHDCYFVDKSSLKVEKVDLFNDYNLTHMSIGDIAWNNGFYLESVAAIKFVESLESVLQNLPEDADAMSVENIKNLLKSIDEEGNAVVMFGKYKN